MKNLLELALEAHGGLTRWSQLKAATADVSKCVEGYVREL
jgi:hypothetical protein